MKSSPFLMKERAPLTHLSVSASIATALISGYGSRQAYAGSCTGSSGTYVCSGVAGADSTQSLSAASLTVTTNPGFGLNVGSGLGLSLSSTGSQLSFTDNNTSSITGFASGLYANNTGTGATSITTTGTVTGTNYNGVYVEHSGTNLTINVATILAGHNGINVNNAGTGTTSITATGTVTGGSGTSYSGVYVSHSGTDLSINATSSVLGGYSGIYATNSGSGITSITTTGTVTGTGYYGIYVNHSSGSNLTINAATVSGGYFGIYATNSGAGDTSITVSGTIMGGTSSGIYNNTSNNSTITLNSGAAVSATSGTAIQDGSGDTTITVNSGAFIIGSVDLGGGTNSLILNGGTLKAATGSALVVTGNVTNSNGIMNFQNSAIDTAATINGNFTGGGQLLIDADFTADTADTLTVTGNVLAGGTQISINDISSGAATGNDITLVSVTGTTVNGDFILASSVVNGAFNYNTLILGATGHDWLLKSVVGTTGEPVFTPFASGFEAIGLSLLTLETVSSFADRTRSRITGISSGDEAGFDYPVWMRVIGGKRDIDSHSSTTGANFDTTHWLAQLGTDFILSDTASSQFVLGMNAGYGRAKTNVSATAGNSKLDTDNYTVGLSGTWFIANGAYVDFQAQKSWYKTNLSAGGVGAGNVNDIDGDGYSVSVEAGHLIALSDTLSITPQAQIIYSKVNMDSFIGANAEVVKLSDSKSLKARMGAELNKQITENGSTHAFVLANVIREFEDETQVDVSGAQLANSVDKWSGELGLGLTHAWDKGSTQYELFVAVTAGSSLSNIGDSRSVEGEMGFKAHF
ncbi:MAG: hypothetical protein COA90_00755 [Gammaproteobacteria bacterium]|nr:MAG: hypothetical protein COA90_00755 [Gammaproteobacteria bacterium]